MTVLKKYNKFLALEGFKFGWETKQAQIKWDYSFKPAY